MTIGVGEVNNCPNLRDVIYGRPLRKFVDLDVVGRSKRQIYGGGYGHGRGHDDRYVGELAARLRDLDREEVIIFSADLNLVCILHI